MNTTYFKIDVNDNIIEVFETALPMVGHGPELVEVTVTTPAFDPVTQKLDPPVDAYNGTTATRTYMIRDKTQGEIDAEQLASDLDVLRDAGKDMALVLVELVDWLLANTAMTANDFTPDVRQAYLDTKTIVDRIK